MKPSPAALALLKEFERGPDGDFAAEPYTCPAGKLTIGWGHVIRGELFDAPISEQQADELLAKDLAIYADRVQFFIRVPITQSMLDALACWAFNIGIYSAANSTLMHFLNLQDYAQAADEFLRWNKATDPKTGKKIELDGLTRRRKAERELFLSDGILG
jgi:lysozyme